MSDHSDHFSPFVCGPISSNLKKEDIIITKRNLNFSDAQKIQDNLYSKISTINENENVEAYFDDIADRLKSTMDDCYPYKTITYVNYVLNPNLTQTRG